MEILLHCLPISILMKLYATHTNFVRYSFDSVAYRLGWVFYNIPVVETKYNSQFYCLSVQFTY